MQERSRLTRLARGGAALLALLLPVGALIVLHTLPAADVADAGLGWVAATAHVVLVVVATLAALSSLVAGMWHRSIDLVLEAGASAAVAAGGVVAIAGGSLAFALIASAAILGAAVVARRTGAMTGLRPWITAVAVMIVAEGSALAGIVPGAARAESIGFVVAAGVAALVAAASVPRRLGWIAGALAIGATGLALDRGGTAEGLLGLAALGAGQLAAVALGRDHVRADDEDDGRLPPLANRLGDAVLRFDGSLRLREWNAAARDLLGLDDGSVGQRADDLLGVSIAALPAGDEIVSARGGIGGLDISLHRSGDGVVAIVRDPGAEPETERTGFELRATIEELLRARRTIALQRGELERSATVDPLTGVSSRSAILDRLRMEVAQARRYGHPLAIVLLDVDRFGELNSTHGIGGGDAVLREIALRFRLRVREADAIGRFGSDGFLATLPHTDEAGAATFADALRHRLSQRPVLIGDTAVLATVSIGVATMRAGEDLDLDGVLARVQEALDSARAAGGDRIALDREHGLARLGDRATSVDDADRGTLPG